MYNGSPQQLRPFWGGTLSFPLLLQGSSTARDFGLGLESLAVIDHEGRIVYRRFGFRITEPMTQAIDEALAKIPAAVEDEPGVPQEPAEPPEPPIKDRTWGRVKTAIAPSR